MNAARLEGILMRLARRYAQQLVPVTWGQVGDFDGSLTQFASSLAGYNILVMTGITPPPPADSTQAVATWVEGYVRLYDLLAGALFPSFNQISANYADNEQPPIVVLNGAATPVIMTLAGYVTPYLSARQGKPGVSDFELMGLMDRILDELEADDLPREEQRHLRDEGAALLRQMLACPVRQRRLTEAQRTLSESFDLDDSTELEATPAGVDTSPFPPPPDNLPEATMPTAPMPPPPDILPEEEPPPKRGDTPFGPSIPVFFERKPRGTRPPPVPDLPEDVP